MIVGVFSDAHGNELGFYKCYNYLKNHADVIYYLGDCVGYFPLSNAIITTLKADKINCLKGNHDAMLLGELPLDDQKDEVYKITQARVNITDENFKFLKQLKSEKHIEMDNRKFVFVHGSPFDSLNGYVYADSDFKPFSSLDADVVFMGHTHRSFIKKTENTLLVNVGSCGLSRDRGNILTVALYDTLKNDIIIKDIAINVVEVLNKYGDTIHQSVKDVLTRNNKIYDN